MRKLLIFFPLLSCLAISVLAQQHPTLPKQLGMVSYTYRNSLQKDMALALDTIRALGITNMEFSNLFGKQATDIRKLLDERGMNCTSFGVSYNDAMNKTAEVAANAKTLGASFVRISTVPYQGDFDLEEAKKTVEDFNVMGKKLKDEFGLTFIYHNHGYEFQPYEKSTLFDYIVQNTNPKYVSFEMDILWTVFPGFDPVIFLTKYPGRFKCMHLKDLRNGIKGDFTGRTPLENDVTLGTGQMNFPEILRAAKKCGVQNFYIEDESPSYAQQVPVSINYLKSLHFFK